MTKEELLIKRFLLLTGKTSIPKFKDKLSLNVYLSTFELPELVTVDYVKNILKDFEYFLSKEDELEFKHLKGIDRYLYIIDNSQRARDYCKKYFKKKEG